MMAASPQFKVYSAEGEYLAALKYAEDAVRLVGHLPTGTTIRWGHREVLWREGQEGYTADLGLDRVVKIIGDRVIKPGHSIR